MKIYFTESYFMDYSRVGYDSVSISHSLKCSSSEKGSSYFSSWYYIEIDDSFTIEEADKLASDTSYLAINSNISVNEAVRKLEKERLLLKRKNKYYKEK